MAQALPEPIQLRPLCADSEPPPPVCAALVAEREERREADRAILAELQSLSGVLRGARSTLRVLLALSLAAAARWAPELLHQLIQPLN